MTDVTVGTDGQTDTDRMLQKEVLNQEIYTEGRNISIDVHLLLNGRWAMTDVPDRSTKSLYIY